ncbi:MAG: PaREP1 family protein [archaeon]|nr:PaREP1 family protein [archaeon]
MKFQSSPRSKIEQIEKIKKYKDQSIKYLKNAFECIETKDSQKASEFLWGSVAEALKAVAEVKGIELRGHKFVRDYARELAKDRKDSTIFDVFLKAESLHRNFYELGTELEEVYILSGEVRVLVDKLFRLIPEEEINSSP